MLRERLLDLPDVTVRLGVNSYPYWKLKEILGRYPIEATIAEVRALLMQNLDEGLVKGHREGGNRIISWDPDIWGYRRWVPAETS